eukprot:362516-Chlamydomonas_euryale.AAC.5
MQRRPPGCRSGATPSTARANTASSSVGRSPASLVALALAPAASAAAARAPAAATPSSACVIGARGAHPAPPTRRAAIAAAAATAAAAGSSAPSAASASLSTAVAAPIASRMHRVPCASAGGSGAVDSGGSARLLATTGPRGDTASASTRGAATIAAATAAPAAPAGILGAFTAERPATSVAAASGRRPVGAAFKRSPLGRRRGAGCGNPAAAEDDPLPRQRPTAASTLSAYTADAAPHAHTQKQQVGGVSV